MGIINYDTWKGLVRGKKKKQDNIQLQAVRPSFSKYEPGSGLCTGTKNSPPRHLFHLTVHKVHHAVSGEASSKCPVPMILIWWIPFQKLIVRPDMNFKIWERKKKHRGGLKYPYCCEVRAPVISNFKSIKLYLDRTNFGSLKVFHLQSCHSYLGNSFAILLLCGDF